MGLQKLITDLDMKNGYKGGVRVGFIYIKDMNNNDGGKGGAYVYEAYEAKQRVAHFRAPVCFINFLPLSLLYISILLTLDRVGCVSVPSAPHPSNRGLPVPESLQPVP